MAGNQIFIVRTIAHHVANAIGASVSEHDPDDGCPVQHWHVVSVEEHALPL